MATKPKHEREEAQLRRFSTVTPKAVDWIWHPYLPAKLTYIFGMPGTGKSSLVLALSALISAGRPLPETDGEIVHGGIIYQSAEDSAGDTLQPRLVAMGADCDNIAFLEGSTLNIADDCQTIENAVKAMNARVLALDPLQGFISSDYDMNRAADMRRLMNNLAMIADNNKCAVIAIGHMTKAAGAKNLYRGLGSVDITAAARSVLMVERSEDDPSIRVMSHIKSSLAQEGAPLAFQIENDSAVTFLGKYENDADGDGFDFTEPGDENKRDWAASVIVSLLSDGAKPATLIQKACADAGIGERTVNRAKKALGIQSVRKTNEWYWKLPNGDKPRFHVVKG